MAYIISADDIKESLPGYDPEHSEKFHHDSARIADKQYQDCLKHRQEKTVILMSGGTASGKTEYVSAYLKNREVVVFDGTLPSFEGASIKVKRALKYNKKVEIHAVMPLDLRRAFIAFLNRDRKFPPEHFFATHSQCRKTLLEIAQNIQDIKIDVYFSETAINKSKIDTKFTKLWVANRGMLIEFLNDIQYTEDEIKRMQGIYDN